VPGAGSAPRDGSSGRGPVIAVFGSSAGGPGDPGYEEARLCGRLLAEAGYTVATGGYGGTMEGCSRGAVEAGGWAIGVTAPAAFPDRPGPNRWVQEELPAATITERIHTILSLSAGCLALDGSIGTLTELVVAWNVAFVAALAGAPGRPVVAVGPRWRSLVPQLAAAIGTNPAPVTLADDVAAAVAALARRVPCRPTAPR